MNCGALSALGICVRFRSEGLIVSSVKSIWQVVFSLSKSCTSLLLGLVFAEYLSPFMLPVYLLMLFSLVNSNVLQVIWKLATPFLSAPVRFKTQSESSQTVR